MYFKKFPFALQTIFSLHNLEADNFFSQLQLANKFLYEKGNHRPPRPPPPPDKNNGPSLTYIHHRFMEMNISLSKWLINSILWHFKINADISILDKSVILGLPFCVFAGYSVLPRIRVSRKRKMNVYQME